MNQVAAHCVVSGYESLIPTLSLPDSGDCHVFAAAIKAGAAVIVTFNLSDFPAAILATHDIRAAHPDDFLSVLFDEQPTQFLRAVKLHRASLRNPPKDAEQYHQTLRTNRLHELALRLADHTSDF